MGKKFLEKCTIYIGIEVVPRLFLGKKFLEKCTIYIGIEVIPRLFLGKKFLEKCTIYIGIEVIPRVFWGKNSWKSVQYILVSKLYPDFFGEKILGKVYSIYWYRSYTQTFLPCF